MGFDVIIAETTGVSFGEVSDYVKYLSPRRRVGIAKKRSDEDKLLSLAAGLLTGLELSRRTGIPRGRLRFTHNSFGKPYVIGSDIQFSISHTKGAVCAAFSDMGEIGADIEKKSRRVSDSLYKRVLNSSEKPLVRSGEDFIRIWVRKEAFLKRLGTGIASDLRGADTTILRDTGVFECGDYFVGISGKGAETAQIRRITLRELLEEYDGII